MIWMLIRQLMIDLAQNAGDRLIKINETDWNAGKIFVQHQGGINSLNNLKAMWIFLIWTRPLKIKCACIGLEYFPVT